MSFDILYSKRFIKSLDKLTKAEQKQVARKIVQLASNPFHGSLRTKKIQSRRNYFESSVNMDIRIIWEYNEEERSILIMLNVGHHSILDRI